MTRALTRFLPRQWRVLCKLHAHERMTSRFIRLNTVLSSQDAILNDIVVLGEQKLICLVSWTDGLDVEIGSEDWEALSVIPKQLGVSITKRGNQEVWDQPEIMIGLSIHRPPRGSKRKYPAVDICRSAGLKPAEFTEAYKVMMDTRLARLYTNDGSELTPSAVATVPNLANHHYRCGLTQNGTAYLDRWR